MRNGCDGETATTITNPDKQKRHHSVVICGVQLFCVVITYILTAFCFVFNYNNTWYTLPPRVSHISSQPCKCGDEMLLSGAYSSKPPFMNPSIYIWTRWHQAMMGKRENMEE